MIKTTLLKQLAFWSFCLLLIPAWGAERTTYYHLDLLGSPTAASDSSGQVLWREEYKPYGERLLKPAASRHNTLWYTGKVHEDSLGLSYFGARWQDPELGRFTEIDPVDVQADNLHSFNRYAYANNNPYKFVDPDGRAVETAVDIISLGLSISQFKRDPGIVNGLGVAFDGLATVVPFLPGGFGIIKSAGNIADGIGDVTKGPLKNASGNLDDAARAARTQPHNTPNLTEHARAQMNARGVSVDQVVDAANRGSVTLKVGDPVVKRMSTSSGRRIEVRQDVRTNNVVTVIDKGSAK